MNILIADERKKYHQALLNNGVLTIDKNGVPSNFIKIIKSNCKGYCR